MIICSHSLGTVTRELLMKMPSFLRKHLLVALLIFLHKMWLSSILCWLMPKQAVKCCATKHFGMP